MARTATITHVDAAAAIANTHEWFEHHSGWAPPDPDTLAEWLADDICRCPDDCLVAPGAWCGHGLASWALILDALAETDRQAAESRSNPGWRRSRPMT